MGKMYVPIVTAASLQRRSLTVSMTLAAPRDRQRSASRVNWIVRQLSKANPEGVFIKARWPGRALDTQAKLSEIRENPKILEAANPSLAPVSFEVMLVRDLAGKFSGSRTFIEQVEDAVPTFYEQIGQHLRNYVPPPPKLVRTGEEEVEEKAVEEVACADVVGIASVIDGDTNEIHDARSEDRHVEADHSCDAL